MQKVFTSAKTPNLDRGTYLGSIHHFIMIIEMLHYLQHLLPKTHCWQQMSSKHQCTHGCVHFALGLVP